MAIGVTLAGLGVAAVGLLGLVAPGRLVDGLAGWPILTRLSTTVVLRVGFGAVFISGAADCRFPAFVLALGIGELASALALLVLGSRRLEGFVAWWLAKSHAFVRRWCSGALAIGLVIAYAGG